MKNKYARADPDYTPNNYDLNINKEDINPELPFKSVIELNKEIAECVPLTKKVHIIIDGDNRYIEPLIRFSTSLTTDKGERLV